MGRPKNFSRKGEWALLSLPSGSPLIANGSGPGRCQFGPPQAVWDIPAPLTNAYPALRIRDNQCPNCYFDFFVNAANSIDFFRSVSSAGAGPLCGVCDSIRTTSLAAGASSTPTATSVAFPNAMPRTATPNTNIIDESIVRAGSIMAECYAPLGILQVHQVRNREEIDFQ